MKEPPGVRRVIEKSILDVVGNTHGITRDEVMQELKDAAEGVAGHPGTRKARNFLEGIVPEVLDEMVRDGRLVEHDGRLYA